MHDATMKRQATMICNFEKVFLYMVADQVGDWGEAGLMAREE